jgi:hypothetical protein
VESSVTTPRSTKFLWLVRLHAPATFVVAILLFTTIFLDQTPFAGALRVPLSALMMILTAIKAFRIARELGSRPPEGS